MFNGFDNLPEDYVPHNLPHKCYGLQQDSLVIGATNWFEFNAPMEMNDIADACVIYKSGTEILFVKQIDEIEITESKLFVHFKSTLLPEETAGLNPIAQFRAQLKVTLVNGSVFYSLIDNIKVFNSLDAGEVQ